MPTLNISDETYEKIKDQLMSAERVDISKAEDLIGQKVFIRTVTYHAGGRVKKVNLFGSFLELEDASWVADSGRFAQAIKNGTLSEVEPVGQQWVNMASAVDMFPWKHDLPTKQK